MASNLQSSSEPGTASLLSGILNDIQELFKQQMALFKTEVRSDFRKSLQATLLLVAGALVAFVGAILLCFTAVYGLQAAFALPLWAGFAIVTALVLLIGGGLLFFGREKFRSFNPLPDESVAALKENLEWTTKPR
jgi:putative superfamily III holin-X